MKSLQRVLLWLLMLSSVLMFTRSSSSNDIYTEEEATDHESCTIEALNSSATSTALSYSPPAPPLRPSPKRILFVAHFFVSTDINHMLLMAQELRDRGHECHFIVMEPYVRRVRKAGFTTVLTTPNILQGEDFALLQNAFQYSSHESHWFTYIRKYVYSLVPIAVKYYEPSVDVTLDYLHQFGTPDLMVCSKASEGPIDVAWHYKIPMSVLFTMPLGGMVNQYEDVIAAPDANMWGSVKDQSSMIQRAKKILVRLIMLVNPVTAQHGLQLAYSRHKYGFNPFAIPGDHWKKSLIISPWSMGIDLARKLRPLTHLVGFMTSPLPVISADTTAIEPTFSKEDQEHLQYLNDKTDGVVFCAFGSLAVLTQEWFDAIVEGMDQWAKANGSNAGGVIAVNDLSLKAGLDINRKPSTVQVTGWINQKLFLAHPHTKAFVTHGGLGSLGEAIEARMPMLVFPLFFDQPNNAHRLEEAGVALKLHFREETVTANTIASKLHKLTTDPSFQRNLNRQYQISRRSGGVKRAADLLEDVLLLDGNLDHMIPIDEKVGLFTRTNLDLILVVLGSIALCVVQGCKLWQRRQQERRQQVHVPKSIQVDGGRSNGDTKGDSSSRSMGEDERSETSGSTDAESYQ